MQKESNIYIPGDKEFEDPNSQLNKTLASLGINPPNEQMENYSKEDNDLIPQESESKEKQLPKGDKVAEQLVNLTLESGSELYLDQLGEPHISFPEKAVTAFPIRSVTFRRWLAGKYWEEYEKGFSGDTFQTVVGTLEGKAFHERQIIELYNRIARINGVIYYDLGDDIRVVRVDQNGWEIDGYPNVPVKFRRFNHQMAQVTPIRGGNLEDVLPFINLKSETDKLLFLTYLPTVCIPDIPRVALINTGDQGSAKSTSLRIARNLIDPSHADLLDPISDLRELALAAHHHYCLYLDNLSNLRDELSDAFSRFVTGIGSTKRKLFTDEDAIVFKQKIAVGLSGITLVATRADLLERSLILAYDLIPPENRQAEEELWIEFNNLKPAILGSLFDILSKILKIAPTLKFTVRPRMADYAKYASAAAIALGFTQNSFLAAFDKNTKRQNETALEASVTASAIIQFMSNKEEWESLASELYGELKTIVENSKQQVGGEDGFPKAVNHLWRRIMQVRPNLISIGITATRSESSAGTLIKLTKTVQQKKVIATTATTTTLNSKSNGDKDSPVAITATENDVTATNPRHGVATMATMAVENPILDETVKPEIPNYEEVLKNADWLND